MKRVRFSLELSTSFPEMAPKRKQEITVIATARVTRSSTRVPASAVPQATDPEPPKKKMAKTTTAAADNKQEAGEAEPPLSPVAEQELISEPETPEGSKTIIIEHCKQCNSFKTRAVQVKNGLEKNVAGINVVVNPEKPRKGCFEIREKDGEIFVSLVNMKRPFALMKALDMENVVSDIVEKIK